jgi:nitrite reductase/ring-hydroxylating ferredoxin subunit
MLKTLPVVSARDAADPSTNLYAHFPSGWFMLALSSELTTDKVLTKRLAGRDVVLFRTESGKAVAIDPYCPHLGAHLGHGGCVKGESIVCPFHAFRFGPDGKCVATGYGTPAPPKLRAGTRPVHETHGLVMVWYGSVGEAPTFDIPDVDTTGWLAPRMKTYTMRGHPQETSENSVDMGHLGVVHGYRDVKVLRELRCDPGHLSVKYSMVRPYVPELTMLGDVYAEFFIHVIGLGYSRVEVEVPRFGLRTRHLIFATPTDAERMELRIGFTHYAVQRPDMLPRALAALPLAALNQAMVRIGIRTFAHDVEQDFDIWNHKTYVHPPQLAVGDGPIGSYRRWAKQFYPGLRGSPGATGDEAGSDAAAE